MKLKCAYAFLVILMLGLVACGAETVVDDESTAAQESEADSVQALAPVTETPDPTPTADEDTDEPAEDAMENANSESESETLKPVSPVEIDLREITPVAPDPNETPQEAPAPGRPGPRPELLEPILTDLARRLGTTREAANIELVRAELLNWPDTGLGCPAPGMMYLTVLTPGYKLTFKAGGQEYIYHTDLGEAFVLCVGGQPAGR